MRKQDLLKKTVIFTLAGVMLIGGTLTAHAATGQWKQDAVESMRNRWSEPAHESNASGTGISRPGSFWTGLFDTVQREDYHLDYRSRLQSGCFIFWSG